MARNLELAAAIQAAADATGNVSMRAGLGAPGQTLLFDDAAFPSSPSTEASGQAWTGTPSAQIEIMRGIGNVLERGYRWAEITTNGAAVAPTVVRGHGISAATKDEGADTLTLTLTPAAATAPIALAVLAGVTSLYFLEVVSRAVGSVVLAWRGLTVDFVGETVSYPRLDINSRTVLVAVIGEVA